MARLVYAMNVSLDGFINTPEGSLDWADVDDELHSWFNDRTDESDLIVYGRRLYEVMASYWPNVESEPDATDVMREFGRIWNSKPKVVFSTTLEEVGPTWRLVRGDVVGELKRLKAEIDGQIEIGGPTLARDVIRAGLVDEFRVIVHPVVLGAGTPFFPPLESPIHLRQLDARTFASGVVALRYAAA
jgi:dihydrofolate reductase